MSFYMIVNSQQSASVFRDNKPFHFFTHLKSKLSLNGVWKVAVVDIKIPLDSDVFLQKDVYLFCNMCGESIVDGVYQPLLRRICLSASESDLFSFQHISYVPVIKNELFDIEFYITDEHGDKPPFLTRPVSLTLHFKSYPFLF